MEYTPEHFEELHDRNENFDGRVADFGKFATYNQIKTALVDFMQRCDEVERIDEQSPIPHEMNALICVTIKQNATFDHEETFWLTDIMRKADLVVVTNTGNKVKFCFGVENVWKV